MDRSLFWFRDDLRLHDQPGLLAALQCAETLLVYIMDPHSGLGTASKHWLTHSLIALNESLDDTLNLYEGLCVDTLLRVIQEHKITHVYWNQGVTPKARTQDQELIAALSQQSIFYQLCRPNLLWDFKTHMTQSLEPYKVFTPFYKSCRTRMPCPEQPINFRDIPACKRLVTNDRLTLTTSPLHGAQRPGEREALTCMQNFFSTKIQNYDTQRDYPAKNISSHLSAYVHFGELSIRTLWYTAMQLTSAHPTSVEKFCSELGWREFAYYLLYHFPYLPTENYRKNFNHFPWERNKALLYAWQKGTTGYPLVDAGMRELSQTGSMHNRVRMVTASFLIKNLNIHWHDGRDWFWDTLYDADLASNSMNWQWVAGTGFDASPYIRIFNPTLQAEKFDPDGIYIRHFVPELSALPTPYLFEPWKAPQAVLSQANIQLDITYPRPIIDLSQSRAKALNAYAACQKIEAI